MGVKGARLWTPEEDGVLHALYASLDVEEVGRRLGRSVQAVRMRAHKIGATRCVWNTNLSGDVRRRVVSLYESGRTMLEVQEGTGLSYHQVRWCLGEVGIVTDRARAAKFATRAQMRILTPVEQEQVRGMWAANVAVRDIAAELGCWEGIVERFRDTNLPPRDFSLVLSENSGTRRVFSEEARAKIVRLYTEGLQSDAEVAKVFGCCRRTVREVLRGEGVDLSAWHGRKLSERAREAFRSGQRVISPKAGHGIKTPHQTPFQGVRVMRSRTEAARAKQLDEAGTAWFYEVQRFNLVAGDSYLPDFWITDVSLAGAKRALGDTPSLGAIRDFLGVTPHKIEDVKGWYGEKHPSKPKIDRFMLERPDLKLCINVFNTLGV